MLKAREAELGRHTGDGLTAAQADELLEKIRIVLEWPDENIPPTPIWEAFRATVNAETAWLFEDRDPIGASIIRASRQIRNTLKATLEDFGDFPNEDLQKYMDLSALAQAANRQVALGKGGFSFRVLFGTAYATFLYRLGSFLGRLGGAQKKQN